MKRIVILAEMEKVSKLHLKPFQDKKGRKILSYQTKKQSFSLEMDYFFVGYLKFFGPSYFETALECEM